MEKISGDCLGHLPVLMKSKDISDENCLVSPVVFPEMG